MGNLPHAPHHPLILPFLAKFRILELVNIHESGALHLS